MCRIFSTSFLGRICTAVSSDSTQNTITAAYDLEDLSVDGMSVDELSVDDLSIRCASTGRPFTGWVG